jgi:hypothetical protein
MADGSFILFNKSFLQLRLVGARGGRAFARNLRARRALLPIPQTNVPQPAASPETTAEAIVLLDARFPWLRGAEKQVRARCRADPGTRDREWEP